MQYCLAIMMKMMMKTKEVRMSIGQKEKYIIVNEAGVAVSSPSEDRLSLEQEAQQLNESAGAPAGAPVFRVKQQLLES